MLALTRATNEGLVIIDRETGVKIKILFKVLDRGKVRVGVDAPEQVQIIREEILNRKRTEKVNR